MPVIDQVFRQMRHVVPDPHFLGALGTAVLPQHARNVCHLPHYLQAAHDVSCNERAPSRALGFGPPCCFSQCTWQRSCCRGRQDGCGKPQYHRMCLHTDGTLMLMLISRCVRFI